MSIKNNYNPNQHLNSLPQAAPSAGLDAKILESARKMLALENHFKTELLLVSEHARLDHATQSVLQTAMANIRHDYGQNFDTDYRQFVVLQKLQEPDLGRG